MSTFKNLFTSPCLTVCLLFSFNLSFSQFFQETQKLLAPSANTGDLAGAQVSISGDYAILGASLDTEDENGQNPTNSAGSAHIFERNQEGNWSFTQQLVAPDRAERSRFGFAVNLFNNFAIVGAIGHEVAGAAYIYNRNSNGSWELEQILKASDRGTLPAQFGHSVSLWGNYAFIGASQDSYYDSEGNLVFSGGSVYIFERNPAGQWNEILKITPAEPLVNHHFGSAISIHGNTLMVGASDAAGGITDLSAIYFFDQDANGIWNQTQKITAPETPWFSTYGHSLSIEGDFAVTGDFYNGTDASQTNEQYLAGAVYMYKRNSSGQWDFFQKIVAPDRHELDLFGTSVSLSGYSLLVGAPSESENAYSNNFLPQSGSAYIFKMEPGGEWVQTQKISANDRKEGDNFAISVALDGGTALIGTPSADREGPALGQFDNSGAAYIFEEQNEVKMVNLVHPNPTSGTVTFSLDKPYQLVTVRLINMLGQTVYQGDYSENNTITVEFDGLSGMYLLNVTADNDASETVKIVKY